MRPEVSESKGAYEPVWRIIEADSGEDALQDVGETNTGRDGRNRNERWETYLIVPRLLTDMFHESR
jgi:hypothetical protein